MKSFLKSAVVVMVVSGFIPGICSAETFRVLGAKALGMGGVGVATSEGAIAQNWNPAGLALGKRTVELNVPIHVAAEVTDNLIRQASEINKLAGKVNSAVTTDAAMQLADYSAFLSGLVKLNDPKIGALIAGEAGGSLWIKKFALSVDIMSEVGVAPSVDVNNIRLTGVNGTVDAANLGNAGLTADPTGISAAQRDKLAVAVAAQTARLGINVGGLTSTQLANVLINESKASGSSDSQINSTIDQISADNATLTAEGVTGTGSLSDNNSSVKMRRINRVDIALGYGHHIAAKWFLVGGNLRVQQGRVGFKQWTLRTDSISFSDVAHEVFKGGQATTRFTADLGVLLDWQKTFRTRIGLVGKNLIPTSFNQPAAGVLAGEGPIKLRPQIRAGVAFWPLGTGWPHWTIASDLDMTANASLVPGYQYRMWGFGTELAPLPFLPLRAGVNKNIAGKSSLQFTAGIGVNLSYFKIDIAGAISRSRVSIEDSGANTNRQVPAAAQVATNIILNF